MEVQLLKRKTELTNPPHVVLLPFFLPCPASGLADLRDSIRAACLDAKLC